MDYRDIDFRAYAHLRGKEEKPALLWGMLVSGILFLAGIFLLLREMGWAAIGF